MSTADNNPSRSNPSGTSPTKNGGSKAGLIAVVVVVFVGAALLAAVVLGGNDDSDTSNSDTSNEAAGPVEQVGEVSVSGEGLIPYPQGATPGDPSSDPAVGVVAPTLTGTDFDGSEVEIGPDGTPKVVLFLAHWCPHCQRELPTAIELLNGPDMPEGLSVYAVSTAFDDSRGAPDPSVWFNTEDWQGPVIRDTAGADAFTSYGGAGFPFAVYLDGDNKVLFRSSGELDVDTMTALWLATAQS